MTDQNLLPVGERYAEWLRFVQEFVKRVEAGRAVPVGPSETPPVPPVTPAVARQPANVVVCSPHPDDEALIGALPLRLRLEAGARVADCAITLGSRRRHRARRLRELESACRVLGFDLIVPQQPSGFDDVNLASKQGHPAEWAAKVEALRQIFDHERPDVVFAPHADDFNTTHIGTHYLVSEALAAHLDGANRGPILFILTEFWHPMADPNLMLGVSPEIEAILVMAAAEHGGEVTRNPYHLLHPARLMDNVRRGSEVVGGQGAAAQPFTFAELYRVMFMKGREVVAPRPGGRVIGPEDPVNVRWLTTEFLPEGH